MSTAAKVSLLGLAALAAGRFGDHRGADRLWAEDVGWWTSVVSGRVVAGAALTALALRVPAVAVDAWFEFRFRHGRRDHTPVPALWFASTTALLTLLVIAVLMLVTGPIHRLAFENDRWPFIVAAAVVAAIAGFSASERWLRRIGGDDERPIDDRDLALRLERLAARFDLSGLHFATATPTSKPTAAATASLGDAALPDGADRVDRAAEGVPNAYSVGLGVNRRVVMTDALLREPDGIGDFVVAHELTHVAKRHVLTQTAVSVGAALILIAAVAIAAATGQPWGWFGFEPTDPLALPVTALLILVLLGALGPVSGWLSRAQERAADAGAVAVVGVPAATEAKRLYVATTADLRPPWWARLYSPHPAPAERLEFLARQRRATHDERHVNRETR